MRTDLFPFILPLFAYLLGSVPIGWVIGKVFYHKDIRTAGSGNIGATNALRLYGTRTGIFVMILDMGKGFLATWLAKSLLDAGSPLVALCALLVILGHVFPVYLGFKGGKGVATAGGAFLALAPLSLALTLIVFIGIVALTRYVSVGSISAAIFFELHSLWRIHRSANGDFASVALISIVVLMIVLKHRQNLIRLKEGTENKIKFSKKGNA